jgi:WD40 repeat protein
MPRRFGGQHKWIRQVAMSADGKRAVSVSGNVPLEGGEPQPDDDTTISCRTLPGGFELTRFFAHKNTVSSVAMSADGRHVLSGSVDGTVRLFDVDARKELAVFAAHPIVRGVALARDGRFAVSCGSDRTVRLWRLPDLKSAGVVPPANRR